MKSFSGMSTRVITLLAIAAGLVLAPGAGAAVTVGGNLAAVTNPLPPQNACPPLAAPSGCGVIQVTKAFQTQAAPTAGVVTSWRGVGVGPANVFVADLNPTSGFMTRIRSSATADLGSAVDVRPTRLPIAAGQYVGLRIAVGASLQGVAPEPTSSLLGWFPVPLDGSGGSANDSDDPPDGHPGPPGPGLVAYNATIELDADQDGYGDETQDSCPSKATPANAPCPVNPPPAFTKKPSVKTVTQGKASRVVFNISEAASVLAKIERKTTGRKVGKSCTKQTRKNAKRKKCTRYVATSTKTLKASSGLNALSLGKLKAATYRLTLTPTDTAGVKGKAVALSLKVKPKPKKKKR